MSGPETDGTLSTGPANVAEVLSLLDEELAEPMTFAHWLSASWEGTRDTD